MESSDHKKKDLDALKKDLRTSQLKLDEQENDCNNLSYQLEENEIEMSKLKKLASDRDKQLSDLTTAAANASKRHELVIQQQRDKEALQKKENEQLELAKQEQEKIEERKREELIAHSYESKILSLENSLEKIKRQQEDEKLQRERQAAAERIQFLEMQLVDARKSSIEFKEKSLKEKLADSQDMTKFCADYMNNTFSIITDMRSSMTKRHTEVNQNEITTAMANERYNRSYQQTTDYTINAKHNKHLRKEKRKAEFDS